MVPEMVCALELREALFPFFPFSVSATLPLAGRRQFITCCFVCCSLIVYFFPSSCFFLLLSKALSWRNCGFSPHPLSLYTHPRKGNTKGFLLENKIVSEQRKQRRKTAGGRKESNVCSLNNLAD
uniref:Uncharacterized protein n=1 Tax=Trypanosoma congolense (strain IL3000) TaxID=1068625 RepID=G0UR22_TRYCI|nr:hypothetical protein, unlikely [Trypanosoma congolense IL3000]